MHRDADDCIKGGEGVQDVRSVSERWGTSRCADWDAFIASLDGIPSTTDPRVVKVRSKDYYWYSPVLKSLLDDKVGELVVSPRTEDEVLRVARACVARRIPLTVRGAGTGNYGQAIPLEGGVILDMTQMKRILWHRPGRVRLESGIKMVNIDREVRKSGWELRMYPSTKRTATIGGFIAGGSGGVGSVTHGMLADLGNINALRIVTLEENPRVIDLRVSEVHQVHHAYGTNGIITELEIALAPAQPWMDAVVAFDDFMTAARFGQALGESDGIIKHEIAIVAWPIPQYFAHLKATIPPGSSLALLMVAEYSLEALEALVHAFGGTICYLRPTEDVSNTPPLYEYTWNHTTLHALREDPAITYLQSLFPAGRNLELVEHMYRYFGDEVPMHLEFIRFGGKLTCSALQLVRYTSEARLNEIMAYHEAHDVRIFNPHTHILEDGGMKTIDEAQLGFKRIVDPYGLMNPGKMRGWWERAG